MKRRFLTLGGLLLVEVVLAVWRFGYQGIDPRLIFWQPPGEVLPPVALDELAELDVSDTPLDDVLKLLSKRYGVPIEIDSFA